jgi:hypothetical protein
LAIVVPRLLDPLRNLLCRHLRRRVDSELLDQVGHSREDASFLLAVHQPLDELRISGLAFRLESIHFEGHKCIQRPVS